MRSTLPMMSAMLLSLTAASRVASADPLEDAWTTGMDTGCKSFVMDDNRRSNVVDDLAAKGWTRGSSYSTQGTWGRLSIRLEEEGQAPDYKAYCFYSLWSDGTPWSTEPLSKLVHGWVKAKLPGATKISSGTASIAGVDMQREIWQTPKTSITIAFAPSKSSQETGAGDMILRLQER